MSETPTWLAAREIVAIMPNALWGHDDDIRTIIERHCSAVVNQQNAQAVYDALIRLGRAYRDEAPNVVQATHRYLERVGVNKLATDLVNELSLQSDNGPMSAQCYNAARGAGQCSRCSCPEKCKCLCHGPRTARQE